MIRVAGPEDLETILSMGKQFVSEAEYSKITDEEVYKQIAVSFLNGDRRKQIIILDDDVGIIAGMVTKFPFSDKDVAMELMWWVHPDHRSKEVGSNLLKAFEYWAETIGVSYINLTCLDDRVGKFYENNGFKLYERVYMKELDNKCPQ